MAEPTVEVRRYVMALQAREGYPPQDAAMAEQMESPQRPEIVSVVKAEDYEDLQQQVAARDERVLDLEADVKRLRAALVDALSDVQAMHAAGFDSARRDAAGRAISRIERALEGGGEHDA